MKERKDLARSIRVDYSLDRVRINSKQDHELLRQKLPIAKLNDLCKGFYVKEPYRATRLHGYRSRLEILGLGTDDIDKFFGKLKEYEFWLMPTYRFGQKPYYVSYLEVAKDLIYKSIEDATTVLNAMIELIRKKYSCRYDIFIGTENNTLYLGLELDKEKRQPTFFFRAYVPRKGSKLTGEPCLHCEWVMKGANQIRNKTGISTLSDFIGFDLIAFFEKTDGKFLEYGTIDWFKVGKYLTGSTRKKKLTERQRMSVDLMGVHFRRYILYEKEEAYKNDEWDPYMLTLNPADLRKYIKEDQAGIKSKPGPKTKWEQRILALNCQICTKPTTIYSLVPPINKP